MRWIEPTITPSLLGRTFRQDLVERIPSVAGPPRSGWHRLSAFGESPLKARRSRRHQVEPASRDENASKGTRGPVRAEIRWRVLYRS